MSCTKDKKDTAANETAAKRNKKLSKAKAKKGLQSTFPFHPNLPQQPPLHSSRRRFAHSIVLVQLPFVELKQFVTFAQVACRLCLLQQGCQAGWGRMVRPFDNEINEE